MVSKVFIKGVLLTFVLSLFGWVVPAGAQEAAFTDLHDLVPDRCFSAALSTVSANAVDIGIESGFNPATWIDKACIASTTPFHSRTVTDTFTVTVTAPPGMRIARVTYQQTGAVIEQRGSYWEEFGTGTLTVNNVPLSFSFTTPTLTKTVDLTGQNVESTTVSIMLSLTARRNSFQPRVTAPPGSATILVGDALLQVEYE